jgi:hypothetical protein
VRAGAVAADHVLTLALTAARWTAGGVGPLLLRAASSAYVDTTVVAP